MYITYIFLFSTESSLYISFLLIYLNIEFKSVKLYTLVLILETLKRIYILLYTIK